jgi:TatD DNase family protein
MKDNFSREGGMSPESDTLAKTKTSQLCGVFDTHAHLTMIEDRGIPIIPKITELFEQGFTGIIDIGTESDDLPKRLACYSSFDKVWFSAGIWPSHEAIENRYEALNQLKTHIEQAPPEKIIAIGECGLDRHWNNTDSNVNLRHEAELFSLQLELAETLHLPLIVHSREAPEETLAILKQFPRVQSIIHCYSYGAKEAEQFLELGAYLSFSGTLTYKNAENIREALLICPLDRLLFETDSPYLSPLPFRGKTAEPGMTDITYRFAAEKWGMDVTVLKNQVLENIKSVFNLELS